MNTFLEEGFRLHDLILAEESFDDRLLLCLEVGYLFSLTVLLLH